VLSSYRDIESGSPNRQTEELIMGVTEVTGGVEELNVSNDTET
jgi:hypothetical protein